MTTSKGLVLDLDFAEKSGTMAGDASRYGNDGALTGCKWVENGLEFNGSSDYVDCGNDASLDITDAITISVWVKPNRVDIENSIICRGTYNVNGYYARISNTSVQLRTNQLGDNQLTVTTDCILCNTWQHIVVVRDGTVGQIYVNGIDKTHTSENHLDPVSNTNNMLVGVYHSFTNYFNGSIDQVRICNRALNASEIKAQYDSTKHRYK